MVRRFMCLAALALMCGTPAAPGQETRPADRPAPIRVALKAMVPTEGRALRWSPKAGKIFLEPARTTSAFRLKGVLPIGSTKSRPLSLMLFKSPGARYFDRLWLDRNRNGREEAEEVLSCKPRELRHRIWSSFSDVVIDLGYNAARRPYALSLWHVEDPKEPDAKPVLRWTRRGWHEGTFELGGKKVHLYLAESRLDGLFTREDSWALAESKEALPKADSRRLNDHAWLGERAFRVLTIDPHGAFVTLEEFKPAMTRAQEEQSRNRYARDQRAPRAAKPLVFLKDLKAARAQAKKLGGDLLLDFETTWCGPCKIMDRLVYTSRAVVDKARATRLTAVKIDGDEHPDLKARYKVTAYPTLILLAPDGREKARASGYQSIADVLRLLSK